MLKREIKVLRYLERHQRVEKHKLYLKFPNLESDMMFIKQYITYDGETEIIRNGIPTGEYLPSENAIFSLNRAGQQLLEERRSKTLSFILPYAITTLIAVSSVVVQIVNLID